MKLHKYIIGLALLVSSSSCNFLDEEAYEFITPDNFYKTEADANAALTAVYNTFADEKAIGVIFGWELIFPAKRQCQCKRSFACRNGQFNLDTDH